jgi:hypothetical protein
LARYILSRTQTLLQSFTVFSTASSHWSVPSSSLHLPRFRSLQRFSSLRERPTSESFHTSSYAAFLGFLNLSTPSSRANLSSLFHPDPVLGILPSRILPSHSTVRSLERRILHDVTHTGYASHVPYRSSVCCFCPRDCSSSRFVHHAKSRSRSRLLTSILKRIPSLGLTLQGVCFRTQDSCESVPSRALPDEELAFALSTPQGLLGQKLGPILCKTGPALMSF